MRRKNADSWMSAVYDGEASSAHSLGRAEGWIECAERAISLREATKKRANKEENKRVQLRVHLWKGRKRDR